MPLFVDRTLFVWIPPAVISIDNYYSLILFPFPRALELVLGGAYPSNEFNYYIVGFNDYKYINRSLNLPIWKISHWFLLFCLSYQLEVHYLMVFWETLNFHIPNKTNYWCFPSPNWLALALSVSACIICFPKVTLIDYFYLISF